MLIEYTSKYSNHLLRYDPNKGTSDAKLPVPEPSDVDRGAAINFEDQRNECDRLQKDLERITDAKDKVVLESDQVSVNG